MLIEYDVLARDHQETQVSHIKCEFMQVTVLREVEGVKDTRQLKER